MGRGSLAQWGMASLVVVFGLGACRTPESTTEPIGQSASELSSPSGIPCAARAEAVIANTANVFSNTGSLVDSYQSSVGPYGGTNIGSNGGVQAAEAIVHNGGVIHGVQTPDVAADLPVIPVPAGATNLPLGSKTPGNVDITTSAESLTLAPGNYVAANFTIGAPAAIAISPAGPVQIWVTGNLNLGGDENLNGVPENFEILVTSSNAVNVNVNRGLFGFLYAPTATVSVESSVFGGVVGSTVNLNSSGSVHFDQNSVCPAVDAGVEGGADAGSDASHDVGAEAASDAGHDVGGEAASDASHDAGGEAASDAGRDAAVDASSDASGDVTVDAAPDAGVDAPTCTQASCSTGNPCSIDTCNTNGTCSHTPAANGTTCNDGNACTLSDSCQSGVCTGSNPVTCTASDSCHVAGTCSPSTGACSNPAATNGTTCSDGNACTLTDTCQSGVCTGSNAVTCTASDSCHVAGTCSPSTGACSNPAATNGTACSDGNACTQGDTCQSGVCTGGPAVTCASDACHSAGACNPATGCTNTSLPDGTPCPGGDKCNQVYECSSGTCTGSSPVTCTPSDSCHAPGTCDPATGSCSNPAVANGTACNDGNACTQSDSCQSGACVGAHPVACSPLDACHVAGTCNPATGACSNPNAPNGTSCGNSDASPPQVCTSGACGALIPCTSSQTLCAGVCVTTQADSNNCGGCGQSCSAGTTCMAGKCVSQAIAASCLPTSSLAVLPGASGVTAYVPRSAWAANIAAGLTGVERVAIEGSAEPATIPTPNAVNSCAANWVTGEVVCTSNGTDVYIIQGTTLTATLTSGATALQAFSGGTCDNCGVAIDSSTNQAILSVGLVAPPSLTVFQATGGFQFLDLATNTFEAPISTGLPPNGGTLAERFTSEDITVDPFRHLVLSPNEQGDYQLLQTGVSPALFDQQFPTPADSAAFDSSAEDCSTGIALATEESAGTITLVDLTQAAFTPGSPNGTWSAPTSTEVLPELLGSEATGIAVAPGSHLGLISPEFSGPNLVVFQLPSTSGSGTPALVDYAALVVPNDPGGNPWAFGADPHTVTAYMSPSTNRAMGIISNQTSNSGPSFLATFDLQSILDLPRTPGSHYVDPTYDLVAHGVVTILAGTCPFGGILADPNNCGACGNVCPERPNSAPTCPFGTCGIACTAGFGNCDGVESNGCEANLLTDPANCGGCGVSCAAPNATGACTFGQCSLVCTAGFSDCDGIESNGCETPGPCESPSVSLTGPTSVAAGAATTYEAGGTDPVPGGTLSFTWSEVSGPGEVTFSPASGGTTSADFSAAGTYVVEVTGNDGFAATNVEQTVSVTLVNNPPVVTVGADQTLNSPTLSTTLTGSATDDGLPQGATLSSVWSLVSGPVEVAIASPMQSGVAEPGPIASSTQVTFSYPGTYVFQLAVSDTQLVGVATETVTVNPPPAPTSGADGGTAAAPSAPTVAIGGVTDDQEVTQPTQILGTVSDGSWVLQSRLGGRDDVQTPWTVMASGIGAVDGSTIATFDPTLLVNGIYTLLLSSTNSVGSSSTSVSLSVDARMKVGLFTLTFTDLSTAVGGLPLTVTRTYDSRDKTIGDFGFGWKLGISDVRVEKSGKTGAFWQQQFFDETFFSEFCLSPSQAASVAITFPSGRQYRFTPQASPQCQAEVEDTAPDITWVSTSDPNNPTIALVAAGETSMFANDVGNGVTQLQDDNADIWDPRQFTLTIEDGSVWQIDQDLGVTAIRDLNGNTVTITPSGVVQSSGKNVTFQRDTQGRITSITDPNGASMNVHL
jgi:YD repeat-containing protein